MAFGSNKSLKVFTLGELAPTLIVGAMVKTPILI